VNKEPSRFSTQLDAVKRTRQLPTQKPLNFQVFQRGTETGRELLLAQFQLIRSRFPASMLYLRNADPAVSMKQPPPPPPPGAGGAAPGDGGVLAAWTPEK
jgi:hypothetical protein